MIRWGLFLILAIGLSTYAFWIYLKVDLAVSAARGLALVRAIALVLLLALLFDLRLPVNGVGGPSPDWALLDASLSMRAVGADGRSPWQQASARARALASDGYDVVTFGGDPPAASPSDPEPTELRSLLVPALQRAAEGGARRVTVLSDRRFEDVVAVEAALATLPLEVTFEGFGSDVVNAGVTRFVVPDVPRPDEGVTAEVEVHGGTPGEPITVEILAEDQVVATASVTAPEPGLRATATVELPPPPTVSGRVRYSAVARVEGDAFAEDDAAVEYAAVGREEGALVVLSLRPDWELRYLLPVLREVTGLPTVAYLRAGPDRFVVGGLAIERGDPVDSTTVREAAGDAALVVVHGLGAGLDPWARGVVERPGRKIVLPLDQAGADAIGVGVGPPLDGEWYLSADVPPSPIAGALSGASLQGLPPLTGVLVAREPEGTAPVFLQLRGAGAPVPAMHLVERPTGRMAIATAQGFWRWAAREAGVDAYRRLWSGVVGWVLADQAVRTAEPRPTQWVVERGAPVVWSVPGDGASSRIVIRDADSVVVDTTLAGSGALTTGTLPPGSYRYAVEGPAGDTTGTGRFDVEARTSEMLPVSREPQTPTSGVAALLPDVGDGQPVRTMPWPYLLVIGLLCGEWIGRRRSGLR